MPNRLPENGGLHAPPGAEKLDLHDSLPRDDRVGPKAHVKPGPDRFPIPDEIRDHKKPFGYKLSEGLTQEVLTD